MKRLSGKGRGALNEFVSKQQPWLRRNPGDPRWPRGTGLRPRARAPGPCTSRPSRRAARGSADGRNTPQ
eukprot:2152070-Lingulodinium_polyedra.AAC.1